MRTVQRTAAGRKPYTAAEVIAMWPQARGELTGFARALDRTAGITADELRMALQLAEFEYSRRLTDAAHAVSSHYREIAPSEADVVSLESAEAWQSPEIPEKQFESCVKSELEAWKSGIPVAPFSTLAKCLRHLPPGFLASRPSLLDVGASGGYYRDVLRFANLDVVYTAVDFSAPFKEFAETLYPGIAFDIGDARALPYETASFDIVLSGGCLLHIREYAAVIAEASRVSRRFVVFHRTPILPKKPTTFFLKEAYGIPCLEIHFNHAELLGLFRANGLKMVYAKDVFWDDAANMGHRTFVLEKQNDVEPYASVKSV